VLAHEALAAGIAGLHLERREPEPPDVGFADGQPEDVEFPSLIVDAIAEDSVSDVIFDALAARVPIPKIENDDALAVAYLGQKALGGLVRFRS